MSCHPHLVGPSTSCNDGCLYRYVVLYVGTVMYTVGIHWYRSVGDVVSAIPSISSLL